MKHSHVRASVVYAPIALILTALLAPISANADADAVVLIGHVAPLTGQLANIGKDSENAARMRGGGSVPLHAKTHFQ